MYSAPAFNSDEEKLEQDNMYEQVPDQFRQKVTSFSQQAEAPKLPPMHSRSRKPSDDPFTMQQRASSAVTIQPGIPPSSPLMRSRLYSSPAIKGPSPPTFPAPAPPPSYPAPNPPAANYEDEEDDDESNALYARPEPRSMSNPPIIDKEWKLNLETQKKSATLPVKATISYNAPRSPVSPLPALPETPKVISTKKSKEEEEEEIEEPGYDRTKPVLANQNYDHLELGRF